MKAEYKNFKKTFEDRISNQYQEEMLDFENGNMDDYLFNDITLTTIKTCAEDTDGPNQINGFFSTFRVVLGCEDAITGEPAEPMNTKYWLKTDSQKVELIHDEINESFTAVWNTPEFVEKELIVSLLKDTILINEYCFDTLTKPTFSILFKEGYVDLTQFSEEAKLFYYAMFEEESLLSKEAQDIFLF